MITASQPIATPTGIPGAFTAPGQAANHLEHVELTWGSGADRTEVRISTQQARVGWTDNPVMTVNGAKSMLTDAQTEAFHQLVENLNRDGVAQLPKLPTETANRGVPQGQLGVALLFTDDNRARNVGTLPEYYDVNNGWVAPAASAPSAISNAIAAAQALIAMT